MTSDIDELLEWLRKWEVFVRDMAPNDDFSRALMVSVKLQGVALSKWIAAVEELRTQASLHAIANDVVVNTRTEDAKRH